MAIVVELLRTKPIAIFNDYDMWYFAIVMAGYLFSIGLGRFS